MKSAASPRSLVRRSVAPLVALGLFASPGLATWSILAIKKSTQEVCIAGATCIPDLNLTQRIAIILPGKGAGAVQAGGSASQRKKIWRGFMDDRTPEEILDAIATQAGSGIHTDQYGIVSFDGPPVTFSGLLNGAAATGVAKATAGGDIEYAIQGNVLAGDAVVTAAEAAFLATEGDLSQKVMAAMEAARAYGGDGRCSCHPINADQCGAPPANFSKTAHTAFILLARPFEDPGDSCCTKGKYWLKRNAIGDWGDIDPVFELQEKYDEWREARLFDPDHYNTRVVPGAPRLVADATTETVVTLQMVNQEGDPLTFGGQIVTVEQTKGTNSAWFGPVVDNGDGTHSFTVTATDTPGEAEFRFSIESGNKVIPLYEPLRIEVDPLAELHAGHEIVSASLDTAVPFVINRGAADGGRAYQVLAGASGTSPGIVYKGQRIPLNPDALLRFTAQYPSRARFPGSGGVLDANGRGQATLKMPARAMLPWVGRRIDFVTVLSGNPEQTGVVGFDVVP